MDRWWTVVITVFERVVPRSEGVVLSIWATVSLSRNAVISGFSDIFLGLQCHVFPPACPSLTVLHVLLCTFPAHLISLI